ncbi:electron transfer flavoprotein subunit beta/FixA family protein [Saccharomonospora piscinae]|uniref:electron transfer flavoprotein subunit beta/FixA family protein n=1 Tax=Saccharomonospora piscinae TaxID=687388 RepID=UPI000466415A|nr:electron transfer flavoprotein subunit beta/FixA family protein [Saccharomonospora piscinae]
MNVLVCVKRVPAFGASVPLLDDGSAIDTRQLGFTIGPHEECAVEEAVRLVAAHGGAVTVLSAGPAEAAEQVRSALAAGADHGVVVETGTGELDPSATASAIAGAVGVLTDAGTRPFDLLLFGTASADAGHGQVGARVAAELGLPMVAGVKGAQVGDSGVLTLRCEAGDGIEWCRVEPPVVIAVREGLNLPRYPSMPGRLKARRAEIRVLDGAGAGGGLVPLGLRAPGAARAGPVVLGHGADAAGPVVDVFERLGVV